MKFPAVLIFFMLLPRVIALEPMWHPLYSDAFEQNIAQWVVEQQPGGQVYLSDGALHLEDQLGCTVWFKEKLQAPVLITYTITASSEARVSDVNCFWMASDPAEPTDLFHDEHERTGNFDTYHDLQTYYVGYGGHHNTKTRFRRYTGDGERPLLPEHDRDDPAQLIQPDHSYQIHLVAAAGRAQFYRDGELIFDFKDPEPLETGWFGFRTVRSHLIVKDFAVYALKGEDPLAQATHFIQTRRHGSDPQKKS